MKPTRAVVSGFPVMLVWLTTSAQSQSLIERLVISGPGLVEPIAITEPGLAAVDLEAPEFVYPNRWLQDRVPIHGYEIEFHVRALDASDEQILVADFEWHYGEDRGFIRFPAADGAVSIGLDPSILGRWLYVGDDWGRGVQRAILAANDPVGHAEEWCPVTEAPEIAIALPAPYSAHAASATGYLYGTRDLWTFMRHRWGTHDGRRLAYFRDGFRYADESSPRLSVVARRLDGPVQTIRSGAAHVAAGVAGGDFMTISLDDLWPGCWEIEARYRRDGRDTETLAYTVWVHPIWSTQSEYAH